MLPVKFQWLNTIGPLPKMVIAAIQYLGLKEFDGAANNPVIMHMAKELGLQGIYVDDSKQAWCALIINFIIKICGKPMINIKGDKYNLLRAKWLLNWGVKVPISDMRLGDIGILDREGGGHTFIIIAKTDKGNVIGLGGNQSNQMRFDEFDIKRLIGVRRYYATEMPASAKLYTVSSDGKLSTNEA